eukprot:958432-Pleurochrysis_carterae.AAC.8
MPNSDAMFMRYYQYQDSPAAAARKPYPYCGRPTRAKLGAMLEDAQSGYRTPRRSAGGKATVALNSERHGQCRQYHAIPAATKEHATSTSIQAGSTNKLADGMKFTTQ